VAVGVEVVSEFVERPVDALTRVVGLVNRHLDDGSALERRVGEVRCLFDSHPQTSDP
jgi:hypothetical protein